MTEFGSEWGGWQYKTSVDTVVEKMADPMGGLVLVETGISIRPLLDEIEARINDIFVDDTSEQSHMLSCNGAGGMYLDNEVKNVKQFAALMPDIKALHETAREIMLPVEDVLRPSEDEVTFHPKTIPTPILKFGSLRRTELRPSHVDFSVVTAWLGATKPGLRLVDAKGEPLAIDDAPEGWAFMWRGELAFLDGKQLAPTRHYAKYRRMARRTIALID